MLNLLLVLFFYSSGVIPEPPACNPINSTITIDAKLIDSYWRIHSKFCDGNHNHLLRFQDCGTGDIFLVLMKDLEKYGKKFLKRNRFYRLNVGGYFLEGMNWTELSPVNVRDEKNAKEYDLYFLLEIERLSECSSES